MKKIYTNLTFLIIGMFASVSFADEAFYDSETGAAVIPEILIDGQPHSVILRQNDDSSFKVIESTEIYPDVQEKSSTSKTKRCLSGTYQQTLDGAKNQFEYNCRRPWVRGKDKCYVAGTAGWRCYGYVRVSTETRPGSGRYCYTAAYEYKSDARSDFKRRCGRAYNDQLGDHTNWWPNVLRFTGDGSYTGKSGGWVALGYR